MAINLTKHTDARRQLQRARIAIGQLKTTIGGSNNISTFTTIESCLRVLSNQIASIPGNIPAEETAENVEVRRIEQTLGSVDEKLARAEAAVYGSFVFNSVEDPNLGPLESDLVPVEWESDTNLIPQARFVESKFLDDPREPYWTTVKVQAG